MTDEEKARAAKREYMREYRAQNRDKINEKRREWYEKNREYVRKYNRIYGKKNRSRQVEHWASKYDQSEGEK